MAAVYWPSHDLGFECPAGATLGSISSAALADRRDFNINNASDYILSHAYVSASSSDNWGDDILGKDVLMPGETWAIGFDGGDTPTCVWDVMVVSQQGVQLKFSSVNLCTVTDVNVHN